MRSFELVGGKQQLTHLKFLMVVYLIFLSEDKETANSMVF